MKWIFLIFNSFNLSLYLLAPKTTTSEIIWEILAKNMSNPKIVSAAKEYKFNESHDAKYGNSENRKIEIPYVIRALLFMLSTCRNRFWLLYQILIIDKNTMKYVTRFKELEKKAPHSGLNGWGIFNTRIVMTIAKTAS